MALRDDEASHPTAVAAALRHLCYVGLSCAFQASYSISPYHFLRIRHLSCRPQHTPATWIPKGKYDGFGSTIIVHWNCSCSHRVARTSFQSNSVVWTLAIHPSLPKEFDERVATLHFPALGGELTGFTQEPADSLCFKVEGPFRFQFGCRFVFPDGHLVIVLASGRLRILGLRSSCSFTVQVPAQLVY